MIGYLEGEREGRREGEREKGREGGKERGEREISTSKQSSIMMKHQKETIINHYRVSTLAQFLVRAAVATEHVSVP